MDLHLVATLGGALIIAKIGYTIAEKIIWDWLKAPKNGKAVMPIKAGDMPVTHQELDHYCEKSQAACLKGLEPRFQIMASDTAKATVKEFASQILPRLMRGDRVFEDLEARVQELEITTHKE